MNIGKEYITVVQERFKEVKKLGDQTIYQLTEKDLHWALNDASNSIAVMMKHISGNMQSRWTDFLTTDGEKSSRNRDQEFEVEGLSKSELVHLWNTGWQTLFKALAELKERDLLKDITIRGEKHTVIEAIERQMAHYAYHVGQIVYVGKQIKSDDWLSLSIPKGQSKDFVRKTIGKDE